MLKKSAMVSGEEALKKIIFVLFLHLWLVDIAMGRCLLYAGNCVDHCPQNMHPYHTRCDVDTISQRTCAFPEPFTLGFTCGWSRCDCNNDLVLQEPYDCVPLSDCKMKRKYQDPNKPRRRKRRRRKGTRVKFNLNKDPAGRDFVQADHQDETPLDDTPRFETIKSVEPVEEM